MAASVLAEPEPTKVVQKRSGLVGHYGISEPLIGHEIALGHGVGIGHAHIAAGPLSLGPAHYGGAIGYSGPGFGPAGIVAGPGVGGTIVGANVHTTVTKHVGVPVPAPYPVAVDRPYPVPVKVNNFKFRILVFVRYICHNQRSICSVSSRNKLR